MNGDPFGASGEPIVVRVDRELQDLIPGYLGNRREDLHLIASYIDAGEYEKIRVLGHKMKGSGGGYGFDGITEIGMRMEAAAQAKDLQALGALAKELSRYLERVEVVVE